MCADMGAPEIRWDGRPDEIYETRCMVGAWYVALADHDAISAWQFR